MDTTSLQYQSNRLDCAQASLLVVRSHYSRLPKTFAVAAQLALLEKMLEAALKLGTYMTMLLDGHSTDIAQLPDIAEFCRLAEEMESELPPRKP